MLKTTTTRRAILTAAAATAGLAATVRAKSHLRQTTWYGDSVENFNQGRVHIEGQPNVVKTAHGRAITFDGIDDALFIDSNPLSSASAFTIEAVIRPDGGAMQQRWLHLSQDAPTPEDTRTLFELRVVGDNWYLDAFTCGPGYNQTLVDPQKLHPVGQWYHVAQTCDGTTYRSYVNRAVQARAAIAYTPQGPGRTSIGVRQNHVDYFNGAIHRLRFTPRCLTPVDFLKSPLI